jgi:hypothetical protein
MLEANQQRSVFLHKAKNFDKAAKIVARSFYNELCKAGFEVKHILAVTTEIIANLNEAFRQSKTQNVKSDGTRKF